MNRLILTASLLFLLFACQDDEPVFDKSADERVAEAISELQSKLIAPSDGWFLRYQPESTSGAFNILLNFDSEGKVRIRTDFGVNEGEFYDQTISYRIDNSLGLELIFENYSFFSYLFELDQASFLAEYEFDYVNTTPDGDLVFRSKTDPSSATTIVFQPATPVNESMLGVALDKSLSTLAEGVMTLTPLYRLDYPAKDLSLYLVLDEVRRTISFSYANTLGNLSESSPFSFSTSYVVEGSSIVLAEALETNILGKSISLSSIQLNQLSESSLSICPDQDPLELSQLGGAINASVINLSATITDPGGAAFANIENDIYTVSIGGVFDNGVSVGPDIAAEIPGAEIMVLYYQNDPEDPFLALGYYIVNEEDNTTTIAVKEFTPTYEANKVNFDFAPEYTVFRDTTQTLNYEAMDKYLNKLTEGGNTYIIKAPETISYDYEFYNPCNGWNMVMFLN
ncbi:DUF4302 domain-containing protein [Porifericola rhodea]|uniref:DUF4302 domain-containing protein n=1 Tax=Porifericola rhodea TaxID=930972 RepID=UPI0026658E28|nr:DUF4302 domain-containing protein [Porifericola rhodea]WKN31630.1 DUF4302 domain-containing protein [Porifericola rhodea]